MLCSHLGRPKGKTDPQYSLAPVARRLGELLDDDGRALARGRRVRRRSSIAQSLAPCDVMMIENLRFDPGEEQYDAAFATNLSELGDVYVDDAFGAAHRAHASIVGPPRVMPSAAGRLLAREVDGARPAARRAEAPVRRGARRRQGERQARRDRRAARTLRHAAHRRRDGVHVPRRAGPRGRRLARRGGPRRPLPGAARDRAASAIPTDVVVAREMTADAEARHVAAAAIPDGWKGLDIGPETAGTYADALARRADGAVERSDGRVRARAVRRRHAQRRRGGGRLSRLHRRRRRRQRGRGPADGSRRPTSTTCRPAAARRSSSSSSAIFPDSQALRVDAARRRDVTST